MTKLRTGEPWQPADVYGRSLRGFSLNLVVRSIAESVAFYEQTLTLRRLYSDEDFAAFAGHGLRLMLHADHTYGRMPSGRHVAEGPRGAGVEIRLLGPSPDHAARCAAQCGGEVLLPPTAFAHGWRECHVSDPSGYVFVVGEPTAEPERRGGGVRLRPLQGEDADAVLSVLDEWWGGRPMTPRLPRLFFEYFSDASFAAEDGESGRLVGFLCGFFATGDSERAYIHFVGVDPEARGRGIGRLLYEAFFAAARAAGRTSVTAITAPVNSGSVAFHQAMGFHIVPGDRIEMGLPVHTDREGPGTSHVVFRRAV
jgi:ribosomal protein S18 acetylase RimI-like enzyme/predicted enzyme related to lactoylglutathione lyase